MMLSKYIRDVQQRFEAIPGPAAFIYTAIVTKILRKPEREIAKDVIEKNKHGTILDLGSGTGYLSINIAKRLPNLQVIGIDLSRQMIKIARRKAKGVNNIKFKVANAVNLPFDDDSIDFIISTGSLHHWKNPTNVFNECYRVLKRNKEAWIFDGCPDAVKEERNKIRAEHGLLGYQVAIKIAELHGFFKREYNSKIRFIIDQTKFENNYKMELNNVWMKITLKK